MYTILFPMSGTRIGIKEIFNNYSFNTHMKKKTMNEYNALIQCINTMH